MFLFAPIRLVFKVVNLLLTAAIIYFIYSGVQVVIASNASATPTQPSLPISAIIVMVPSPSSTLLSSDLVGRLDETYLLYQARVSQNVVLLTVTTAKSGSQRTKSMQEESAAKQWLIAKGVPTARISGNNGSTSYAVLARTAKTLQTSNRVVIVTDAINHLWVSGAATSSGLGVAAIYPGNGSRKLFILEPGSFVRQTAGVALGRVIGYGHTTWVNN